ncbi:hypothetical protein Y1Q_0004933 [Alligator mississippiensis]|uniref:Uncharacterized protein n=1 Tax=Alligator mississippiensis TaxID=8496 RepID=A0A151MYA1_ALLMI|nr:hypothetical protein Y1Q_0004933 [Alligator mississippiensis]
MAAQPETAPPEDVQPETAPPETAKPEKKAKPGKGKPEEAKLEDAKPGKAKLVKVEEDAKPEEAKPEDAKPEKAAWRRSLPFQKRAFDQKPESLWQLPLTAKQGLAAATTQCISLAALCVAISYLSWVELEYRAHSDDRLVMRWAVSYTFGVPFSLHSAYWLNTSAEEFNPVAPNFWEQDIMLWARDDWTQVDGIIAGSILALITGFTSFLLDFIEVKKLGRKRLIIAVALHILTDLNLVPMFPKDRELVDGGKLGKERTSAMVTWKSKIDLPQKQKQESDSAR